MLVSNVIPPTSLTFYLLLCVVNWFSNESAPIQAGLQAASVPHKEQLFAHFLHSMSMNLFHSFANNWNVLITHYI